MDNSSQETKKELLRSQARAASVPKSSPAFVSTSSDNIKSPKVLDMLTLENSIKFLQDQDPAVTLRNFYAPENGFVWSSSRWSEIEFGFSATPNRGLRKNVDLIIDFDVFKVDGRLDGQDVLIYLNGLRVGSHHIMRRTAVVIPVEMASLRSSDNILTFDTPDSCSPKQYGMADDRRLGIQLFSLQIRPAG